MGMYMYMYMCCVADPLEKSGSISLIFIVLIWRFKWFIAVALHVWESAKAQDIFVIFCPVVADLCLNPEVFIH